MSTVVACAQKDLHIKNQKGVQLFAINQDFPLLKILLPGEPTTDRGIEIEFPEHVTARNKQSNNVEHLYLVTNGNNNQRTIPTWKIESNSLVYESVLNGNIKMIAKAQLDSDGVAYTYTFTNSSSIAYENLQAVTCVKLYSSFSDTLLQRTYVHHREGFDLLASETPQRLTMPLNKWLPCRYLASYTWPVPTERIQKDEDGITRYYKSKKIDEPFIATISHDQKWIAATFTNETGNVWTNPERSCQHADPFIILGPGETKTLTLKTLMVKGTLEDVLYKVQQQR
jgi:hypothetical protein